MSGLHLVPEPFAETFVEVVAELVAACQASGFEVPEWAEAVAMLHVISTQGVGKPHRQDRWR